MLKHILSDINYLLGKSCSFGGGRGEGLRRGRSNDVQDLVNQAGTYADSYVPGLGTYASNQVNNYIDNPDKYQQMWKNGDGPKMDQGAMGNALGTRAAEMLTQKMAERTAKQNGGFIKDKYAIRPPLPSQVKYNPKQNGGSINPYMPTSLSGGGVRHIRLTKSAGSARVGRPPIQLRDDQSNFIGPNSNAFYPLLPKTVASFQRGGSFKN